MAKNRRPKLTVVDRREMYDVKFQCGPVVYAKIVQLCKLTGWSLRTLMVRMILSANAADLVSTMTKETDDGQGKPDQGV